MVQMTGALTRPLTGDLMDIPRDDWAPLTDLITPHLSVEGVAEAGLVCDCKPCCKPVFGACKLPKKAFANVRTFQAHALTKQRQNLHKNEVKYLDFFSKLMCIPLCSKLII